MCERRWGVVPVRHRIPLCCFTSGQYAWEHSNVSYWACKIDVMLSACHTSAQLPISPCTLTHQHMHTLYLFCVVTFSWNMCWDIIIYIIISKWWEKKKSQRRRKESHNSTLSIIKRSWDSAFKHFVLMCLDTHKLKLLFCPFSALEMLHIYRYICINIFALQCLQ